MGNCDFCDGKGICDAKVKVSFCPKCKSRNVKYVFELRNLFGVVPKMRCGECGFEMPSFPILVVDKNKLTKSRKKKK